MPLELIGLILPPFIDLINTKVSNTLLRFWIAFGVCALAGVLINLNKLALGNLNDIFASIGLIFASAQIVYKSYWEKSSPREVMQAKIK